MTKFRNTRRRAFANSVAALTPAFWAQESLALLEEKMVMGPLVHKDFSPLVAKMGDTVHTRRPGEFEAVRKGVNDDVIVQDVTSTDVEIKLNQHFHVSFLIRDGEESLSMKDLVETYMAPAMVANARAMDRILMGQWVHFMGNSRGQVGGFTGSAVKDYIIDTREAMNTNLAHMDGRNLVLTSKSESAALKPETFNSAEKIGDNGTALRNASLGRLLGFNVLMSQNSPSVTAGFTTSAGAVNNAAGYAIGTTVLTVDGITGLWTVASYITIDGLPYQITATSATLGNTTSITLSHGLVRAVADNAVITRTTPAAVNFGAGYSLGYDGLITLDTLIGNTVKVGQAISFGTTTTRYAVIATPSSTTIRLDRPLEAAVTDNDALNIGPAGEYNFAFHRNALTMVTRPLAMPKAGAGALSAIAAYNGLAMRVAITYNGTKQGHLVTLDYLMGVKVLDTDLGAVLVA